MKMFSNNHSVFGLEYILVITTYRAQNILNDELSNFLKQTFAQIGLMYKVEIINWEHEENCVRVKFRAHPNTMISKFIMAYKSASSRVVKRKFPDLKSELWDNRFWSHSFLLSTLGAPSTDIINDYILKQGEKK